MRSAKQMKHSNGKHCGLVTYDTYYPLEKITSLTRGNSYENINFPASRRSQDKYSAELPASAGKHLPTSGLQSGEQEQPGLSRLIVEVGSVEVGMAVLSEMEND